MKNKEKKYIKKHRETTTNFAFYEVVMICSKVFFMFAPLVSGFLCYKVRKLNHGNSLKTA